MRLPETEGYPLGPDRPSAINFALENDNAALLLACYGREGGPVAAKKCVRVSVFVYVCVRVCGRGLGRRDWKGRRLLSY